MSTATVQATAARVEQLKQLTVEEGGRLFAILDACDEPRVPKKVQELGDRAVSLYKGKSEFAYWAIAPYLVQVDEPLLDWIVANLWNDPWGIFVWANADLPQLRRHFRRFLMVKAPDGATVYFRFYDPRVLPVFLTSCPAEDAEQFFGDVRAFLISQEDGSLIRIARQERVPVTSDAPRRRSGRGLV